jgi:hypothetical protein
MNEKTNTKDIEKGKNNKVYVLNIFNVRYDNLNKEPAQSMAITGKNAT